MGINEIIEQAIRKEEFTIVIKINQLLQKKYSVAQIAELVGVPIEKVEQVHESLKM